MEPSEKSSNTSVIASAHAQFQTLFVLILILLLALLSLILLGAGAGVYGRLAESADAQYNSRTPLAYVTAKVHSTDTADAIRVVDVDSEHSALALSEKFNGNCYTTWIYCFDGSLREILALDGIQFAPGDGEKLMELDSIRFELKNGLLKVTLPESGDHVSIRLRSTGT